MLESEVYTKKLGLALYRSLRSPLLGLRHDEG